MLRRSGFGVSGTTKVLDTSHQGAKLLRKKQSEQVRSSKSHGSVQQDDLQIRLIVFLFSRYGEFAKQFGGKRSANNRPVSITAGCSLVVVCTVVRSLSFCACFPSLPTVAVAVAIVATLGDNSVTGKFSTVSRTTPDAQIDIFLNLQGKPDGINSLYDRIEKETMSCFSAQRCCCSVICIQQSPFVYSCAIRAREGRLVP